MEKMPPPLHTREKEEKARGNMVQSHLDSQKLRMVPEGSSSKVVRGPSKSPAAVTSVAPIQGLTFGDLVPAGRRPKATRGQKITQRSLRQTEVSEFEAERRRAAIELKQRIEAQVSLLYQVFGKNGFDPNTFFCDAGSFEKWFLFSRPFQFDRLPIKN